MAARTLIEWTDATWNVVNGCSVLSPGCKHCYAMRLAGTRLRNHPSRAGLTIDTAAGPVWNGQIRINWDIIDQPLRWARPRMIFANAHGDMFHEAVPMDTIAQIYGTAVAAHHLRGHITQYLTKRADRQRDLLNRPEFWERVNTTAEMLVMDRTDPLDRRSDDARATLRGYDPDTPPPGIWAGVSAEDQERWDERTDLLMETPAFVRWVSVEPMLGPIIGSAPADKIFRMLSTWYGPDGFDDTGAQPERTRMPGYFPRVDWVVCGGESGPGARPLHPDWARSMRDQCEAAGVPFFFKQWGSCAPLMGARPAQSGLAAWPDGSVRSGHAASRGGPGIAMFRGTKKITGRLLDGVAHNGMPA